MLFWGLIFFTAVAQGAFQIDLLLLNRKLRNSSNRFLALLLLLPTLISLDYLLITSAWYRYFPHLFGLSFGLIFLIAPTFFFYIKALLRDDFKLEKKDSFHLLPFLFSMLFLMKIFMQNQVQKIEFINNYLLENIEIELLTYIFYFSHIFQSAFYLFKIEAIIEAKNSQKSLKFAWAKFLYHLLLVFSILFVFAYLHSIFFKKYTLVEVYAYALGNSLLVFAISTRLFQQSTLILDETPKKYQSSNLNESDKNTLAERLKNIMSEEKPYLNAELKLSDLAKQLNTSPQYLSETINDCFGITFNDFLNNYRVAYFQKLLQNTDNEQFTLLSLAYEAGFNSKNTFNTAFKKITGMTPTEYKKSKNLS